MKVYHKANFKNCFEKNRGRPNPNMLIKFYMVLVSYEIDAAATQYKKSYPLDDF